MARMRHGAARVRRPGSREPACRPDWYFRIRGFSLVGGDSPREGTGRRRVMDVSSVHATQSSHLAGRARRALKAQTNQLSGQSGRCVERLGEVARSPSTRTYNADRNLSRGQHLLGRARRPRPSWHAPMRWAQVRSASPSNWPRGPRCRVLKHCFPTAPAATQSQPPASLLMKEEPPQVDKCLWRLVARQHCCLVSRTWQTSSGVWEAMTPSALR